MSVSSKLKNKSSQYTNTFLHLKFLLQMPSRRGSAAMGHFSVSIFFGQVDNKESKKNIVASQYISLAT